MCLKQLAEAMKAAFNSKEKLEQISQNALKSSLAYAVNIDQSLESVIFEFVNYLKTKELVRKFIRNVICENNHSSLHQFVIDNINFLLTYRQENSISEKILDHYVKLSKTSSFKSVVEAFDKVLRQLESDQKVVFSDSIRMELKYIRDTTIPEKVRLFVLLDILINDYPLFSDNNESTLDKLDFYLHADIGSTDTKREQKAYLQIVIKRSALPGQVILFAYLIFENIYNGQPELPEIIPIKYEQLKESVGNSSVKFSKEKILGKILRFIENSEEEIDRKQTLGYQIKAPLMIELFLPFEYLFKKIDRWTRPFGIGTSSIPLCDSYKIIFRSYDRLFKPGYRVHLKNKWSIEELSHSSFACISTPAIPSFRIFNDKSGLVCFLHKTKKFREDVVSIALEKGISIVVWFEPDQSMNSLYLCDPNRCSNHLAQQSSSSLQCERELQQCILDRLIHASQGNSLNDLHAIYDSIEAIKNTSDFPGYIGVLYDEPNRLFRLAKLFKDTKVETLTGVNT